MRRLAKFIGNLFNAISARVIALFRNRPPASSQAIPSIPSPASAPATPSSAPAGKLDSIVKVGNRTYWEHPCGAWYRVVGADANGLWVGRRRPRIVR